MLLMVFSDFTGCSLVFIGWFPKGFDHWVCISGLMNCHALSEWHRSGSVFCLVAPAEYLKKLLKHPTPISSEDSGARGLGVCVCKHFLVVYLLILGVLFITKS